MEGSFALNLLIASLPIIPVGYFARFFIEDQFRSLEVIATTTIVFGLALWAADRSNYKGSKSLTPLLAIWIRSSLVPCSYPRDLKKRNYDDRGARYAGFLEDRCNEDILTDLHTDDIGSNPL